MKKYSLLLLLALMSAMLMTSCESDDDNKDDDPIIENDYYPLEEGSYRVYENSGDEVTYDSTVVMGTSTVSGFEASLVETHSGTSANDMSLEYTAYYRQDGEKIYVQGAYFNTLTQGFITEEIFDADWYLVFDPDLSSELVLAEQSLSDITFEVSEGINATLKDIKLTLFNGGEKTVETEGYNGTAHHMQFNITINAQISVVTVPIELTIDNYYANDIGLVKSDVAAVNVSILGQTQEILPASTSSIIRYNVEM